ncbi:outer membrane protein [Betaproteobacteria bacterium]|nr:outer membrane protein [Betaproteobacteria bacterium]
MRIHKSTTPAFCLSVLAVALAFPLPAQAQRGSDGVPVLGTIVVTATRQETRVNEILADMTVIDRAEIERTGQGTIIDLLTRQPGIQTTSSGGVGTSTSLYMRGANSDQTKVLVDGIPINSIDMSGSPLRYIPLSEVERIEILRGPAATLYGADAIGGVIHVITRRGTPGLKAEAFAGYGSHATREANAALSGGNEHWTYRVGVNHYATDGISAQRHSTHRDADDDAYRNTGGSAALAFRPDANHEFGFSVRENSGLSHYDSGDVPPWGNLDGVDNWRTRFKERQWQVSSRNRFFDERWKSTLQYGQSIDEQDDFGLGGERTYLSTRTRQLTWQNDVRLPLGDLLVATENLRQRIGPSGDYDKHSMTNNAFLAGWTAHIGQHDVQINARADRHSRYGNENTYSLAYGYRLTPNWRTHLSYGTAFKAPTLYQLYTKYWGYGNPNLKPEKARNREAALLWEDGPHTASVTWYYNKVTGLITSNPVTWQADNISKAKLSGLTLAYAGSLGDWRLGASYDRLDARNEDTDLRLGRRARDSAKFNLSHVWGKLDVGAEVVAVGKRYDDNQEGRTLGAYVLANLLASYAFTPELRLEGRFNNLFNKKYETARYYNTDDGFNAFIGLRYTPR